MKTNDPFNKPVVKQPWQNYGGDDVNPDHEELRGEGYVSQEEKFPPDEDDDL